VSIIYYFLCMSIIPILPALFTNRFLVDRASQLRCPAPLYFLLSLQFSSHLFSVTHPTYLPDLSPRSTRSLVHFLDVNCVPHLYSTVTLAFFDCRCVTPVVNTFTQKKHLPQSQGTSAPLGMKLGLSLLFKFPSHSRPMP
jgi:hypothetical protein